MRQGWSGKRKAERRSLRLKASITFYNDLPPLEVMVLDFSSTGARIEFPDAESYPEEFQLNIPARDEQRIARVRWRRDLQAGLEFMTTRSEESLASVFERVGALERRFALIESADPAREGQGETSPVLMRLGELEARLAEIEPAESGKPEVLARLEALEQRLLEQVAAPVPAPALAPEIEDRLTRLEWRLDEIANDLQAPSPGPELARQILYLGERLATLETDWRKAPKPAAAPIAVTAEDVGVPVDRERWGADFSQLSRRMERVEEDLRGAIERVTDLQAAEIAAEAPPAAAPDDLDLRRQVADLKASMEALILALSLGLGRAA
jgi:hypothetical protein